MDNTFKDVIAAFDRLKAKFQNGEIARQEFIDEMKKLRIKDDQGRFWMIGAQTGKWYYFDGKDWVQDEPPSHKDKKAICVHCGFENRLESDACGRCGGTMKESEPACEKCGAETYQAVPRLSRLRSIGHRGRDGQRGRRILPASKDREPGPRNVRPVPAERQAALSIPVRRRSSARSPGSWPARSPGATGYFAPSLGFPARRAPRISRGSPWAASSSR